MPGWVFVDACISIAMAQVAVLTITVFLHRTAAHRSVTLHPIATELFRIINWLLLQISVQEWVAVHRLHHRYTDQDGDPHSPRVYGLAAIVFRTFSLYDTIATQRDLVAQLTLDLQVDGRDRFVYSRRWLGRATFAILLVAAVGLGQAVIVVVLLYGQLYGGTVFVNGACHLWGSRPTNSSLAGNITVLALVTGGEALHHNHHVDPGAARFSRKPWQLDPGYGLVRLLAVAGLAQGRPQASVEPPSS